MKRNFLIHIFMILSAGLVSGQSDHSYLEVVAAAQKGFSSYLEKIPVDQELSYGFKNRDEFKRVKIGKPYQIVTLDKSFYSDSKLTSRNYLMATGEWRVALTIDNQFRTFVTVAKMNGQWEVVGIGAAELAKELNNFEIKHNSTNAWGLLFRIYQPNCEFVLSFGKSPQNIKKVYSLSSSRLAFNQSRGFKNTNTLTKTLSLIKQKMEVNSENK